METLRGKPAAILLSVVLVLSACLSAPAPPAEDANNPPIAMTEPPAPTPTQASPTGEDAEAEEMIFDLPQRPGPRVLTSGTVPHVQIEVDLIPEVNDELFRLAYALPDVENRPTIVSLPGARGMWISEDVPLVHPEVIVSGREFAHIHPDGSLHLALPFERALEVAETGWGERHPWADERENWEGFVMLYTPQSMDELTVTFQLILESYNFVTGREITLADLEP